MATLHLQFFSSLCTIINSIEGPRKHPTNWAPQLLRPALRKHVFRDDYEKEFANVKQSRKGKSYAHCCYCDSEINLEAM